MRKVWITEIKWLAQHHTGDSCLNQDSNSGPVTSSSAFFLPCHNIITVILPRKCITIILRRQTGVIDAYYPQSQSPSYAPIFYQVWDLWQFPSPLLWSVFLSVKWEGDYFLMSILLLKFPTCPYLQNSMDLAFLQDISSLGPFLFSLGAVGWGNMSRVWKWFGCRSVSGKNAEFRVWDPIFKI